MFGWSKNIGIGLLAASVAIAAEAPAYAAQQPIWLEVNQSYYLNTGGQITRVAVANPKIADVNILGASALNVVAFGAGTTTLTVWTSDGIRQEFQVVVSSSDSGLAALIQKTIGLPGVRVDKIGDKVILTGTVQNQRERDRAVQIASMFVQGKTEKEDEGNSSLISGGVGTVSGASVEKDDADVTHPNVINLIEMVNPDQINIEALVIEINSSDAKNLGIQFGSNLAQISTSSTSETTNTSSNSSSSTSTTNTISFGNEGIYFAGESFGAQRAKGEHWYDRNWLFTHFSQINARISALITQGKARIVSRPNITTMSGKTAGILVGGKVPYPVNNGNGSTSVSWQNYGIELDLIKPVVDQDNNVTARLFASVSRLDWANAVSSSDSTWPALATRQAETMVNVPSGMTMVIGGLLNSEDSRVLKKVPLLGNIPILGELFKYHEDSNTKTEIMILITPRVVNETTPTRMTDQMRDMYRNERRAEEKRPEVDVNEPVPSVEEEKAAKLAEQQKKTVADPKLTQEEDSILGKYLHQDVLRKPTEDERREAKK